MSAEYNPTSTQLSGVVFQFTNCSHSGAISATYTSTFNPTSIAGTANGPFTNGSQSAPLHGHYTGNYQFTSDSDATCETAITVFIGTDGIRGVTGKGSERCSTNNAGATLTGTEVLELTGL